MVRFAPRFGQVSSCLVPRRTARPRPAANDNARARAGHDSDALVAAALRLFAEHGFAAAGRAADAAEAARRDGDFEKARWWVAVCHTLDRREAQRLRQSPARRR